MSLLDGRQSRKSRNPSFLEDESSTILFQRFAHGLETGSEGIVARAALSNTTFPTRGLRGSL